MSLSIFRIVLDFFWRSFSGLAQFASVSPGVFCLPGVGWSCWERQCQEQFQ